MCKNQNGLCGETKKVESTSASYGKAAQSPTGSPKRAKRKPYGFTGSRDTRDSRDTPSHGPGPRQPAFSRTPAITTGDSTTNCSTTSSASRGGPHRNRTHAAHDAAPCASPTHTSNKLWHIAAPSSPMSHDRGAAGIAARQRWHVACRGRSWSRCNCLSALPTSRSLPNPVPAPALRSTSAA